MNVNAYKVNILGTLALADANERKLGENWYAKAVADVSALAAKMDIAHESAAGVVSALSPNCPWSQNIQSAERLIRQKALDIDAMVGVMAYKANRVKALAILAGAPVGGVLGARKTYYFWRALCGDSQATVIDGHALNIARGAWGASLKQTAMTPKQYFVVAQAYRDTADYVGMTPCALQATTWVTWRRLQGVRV